MEAQTALASSPSRAGVDKGEGHVQKGNVLLGRKQMYVVGPVCTEVTWVQLGIMTFIIRVWSLQAARFRSRLSMHSISV